MKAIIYEIGTTFSHFLEFLKPITINRDTRIYVFCAMLAIVAFISIKLPRIVPNILCYVYLIISYFLCCETMYIYSSHIDNCYAAWFAATKVVPLIAIWMMLGAIIPFLQLFSHYEVPMYRLRAIIFSAKYSLLNVLILWLILSFNSHVNELDILCYMLFIHTPHTIRLIINCNRAIK